VGFPFFVVVINLPLQFQIVNGDAPNMAGVHLLPLLAAAAVGKLHLEGRHERRLRNTGSTLGGILSSKKNLTSYGLIAATSLMLLGCGLLSTVSSNQAISPSQYGYQAILGFGIGLSFTSLTMIAALSNKHNQVGE
jgi:hypothetical protein